MKFETVLKPFVAAAMCVCTAFGGADAATGSGGGTPVTITVKDWTGKVVTTVRGVTLDGNFTLDTADHFNGKVDYVTAFDGGKVKLNGTNAERASSSVVNYSGITGESFATEVFVQPYVPTAAGCQIPDPYGVKAPNENRWIFTGTTASSIMLASLTSFPSSLAPLTFLLAKDVSNFADGYSTAVWAPEVIAVRGNWYIYFSASTSSNTGFGRSFVMSYKGSSSSGLTAKSNWSKAERIVTPEDRWAIDGTVFEGKDGKIYYVWSGWPGTSNGRQNIYLAPMETPTSFAADTKRTLVSTPDQGWELGTNPVVNEGPAVLQKGDKTIVVFSGNGSWAQNYALGYTVCSDGNYTNAGSWKKHEGAVFSKRSFAYGPGHCSFTKDVNGLDYIIYHATATATAPSDTHYWDIRNARLQPFAWHDDEPVFGAPRPTSGTDLAPAGESYSVTKSWTRAGSADKTFVHAPTAVTVTGRIGSTVSPTFLENDYFTVGGTTSLSSSKTVTLTLALKDATATVWDDGTTADKTCKFTAELTGEDPEATADDLTTEPIPDHADWGYVSAYTQEGTPYVAYVYTNQNASAMSFTVPSGVTAVDCLVVAGGGAGGKLSTTAGAGGGAGGLLQGWGVVVSVGDVLSLAVGKGGETGVAGGGGVNDNGFDSVIAKGGVDFARAIGGGAGGNGKGQPGRSGGSGGGSCWQARFSADPYAVTGTEGQGNAGGARESAFYNCQGATGGGGAGSDGEPLVDANTTDATSGGDGRKSAITGKSLWYAAGGGGATAVAGAVQGKGGSGIGGNGGAQGTAGLDGTGSGGGGSSVSGNPGGKGGSGVIVIRYATAGENPPPAGHTHVWSAWTKTQDPTCEAKGKETRTCTAEGCSNPVATETQTIPALGHHLVADPDSDRAATCSETGISGSQKCDRPGCTHKVAGTEIAKVAHVYVDGECQWCHQAEPEVPTVTAGPIPGHADWGYINTYTQGDKSYAAYVYTNVTATMTFTVPADVTSIDYLVVGGGGAGGRWITHVAGGGGAGGLLQGTGFAVSAGDTLTLTVGKGGVQGVNGEGRTQANSPGEDKFKGITSTACNGFDSVVKQSGVELLRAYGGAGGGAKGATKRGGGSGGGTGAGTTAYVAMPGTEGQGHDGGARESAFSNCAGATGGGGAGSAGGALTDASSKDGTNGGEGLQSSITGELLWYAGGGGGAAAAGGTHGKGGNGIGGDGDATGAPGLDGTGSGGGGSSTNGTKGGDGGSGVIVIRYATSGGDPEPAKPTVGGKTVEPAAVFETARSDKPIKYPSKPTLAGEIGAQTIAFDGGEPVKVPEYYTATLGEDERTVTLALNDNAKPAFGDETAAVGGEENRAVEVTSDGTVKLHLTDVRPELYYTLKRCDALGGTWEPVKTVKGDADGFNGNFTDNQGGDAGFYKVDVSDVPDTP